eukprot:5164145-Lingulodinium_polyedra.AAC.1
MQRSYCFGTVGNPWYRCKDGRLIVAAGRDRMARACAHARGRGEVQEDATFEEPEDGEVVQVDGQVA